MSLWQYPLSPEEQLKSKYVGLDVKQLPTPAAIIDVAKVKTNCKLMLDAVETLQLSFRAHVKTHKCSQLTRLQLGDSRKDVRLIASTIAEAEQMVPLLKEYKAADAKVNLLYGIPVGPSQVGRLAAVANELGNGSMTFMIDNTAQFSALEKFRDLAGGPASVFLKTDSGYHRAGLDPLSAEMRDLVSSVGDLETRGVVKLLGFYSHNSLSYGGASPDDAMMMLKKEIDVCREAAQHLKTRSPSPLVVSVGASPTALSIQNLSAGSVDSEARKALESVLQLTKSNFELEIHAGVYPLFDLQQVAASSRHYQHDPHEDIAVTVLAEVCSLYPNRTDKPEALISAGGLALAREPCKDYPGWGVVTTFGMAADYKITPDHRIIVSRISQEHGILGYEQKASDGQGLPLQYGQKLRIWPNHACITLAMFGYYFIIDSSTEHPEQVVDVWSRWRGW